MRELVRYDEETRARTLGDVLYVDGVDSRVDEARDGSFIVWVRDEEQLEQAKELRAAFEEAPDDPRFAEARREAERRRKQEREEAKQDRFKTIQMRERWARQAGGRKAVTTVLMGICVGVFLLTGFGDKGDIVEHLTISSFAVPRSSSLLHDIFSGQVWRLVTPIFLHFGFLHILFNMMWLRSLGTQVESREGPRALLMFVLFVGVFSNLAQLYVPWILSATFMPRFGGMSGVVYGLLGYVWLRGRRDPRSGYSLPPTVVVFMLVWLVLGFVNVIGPIANWAHLGGLALGLVAALRPTRR
jgi:GlpG protein